MLVAIELDEAQASPVDPVELEAAASSADWYGMASRVDQRPMYEWPLIADVMGATRSAGKPCLGEPTLSTGAATSGGGTASVGSPGVDAILGRRSAQRFDDRYEMSADDFFGLLEALSARHSAPQDLLACSLPFQFLLFVQRVGSVPPGVYVASAQPPIEPCLATRLRERLTEPPLKGGPTGLAIRLLARVEPRPLARLVRGLHCGQNIAAQACFALGMIASFDGPVAEDPANYRRLHRQAGLLGHILYLEAEKRGLRGTGIGCFFDDAVHDVVGLSDTRFQSLYHFTVGKAALDPHLEPTPPYPERLVTPAR